MYSIINKAKTIPFFLVLMPLFFVVHGFVGNFGLVGVTDGFLLLLGYLAGIVIIYGLVFLFLRNRIKASLLTAYLAAFYLFFGAFYDFLDTHTSMGHLYTMFFGLFVIGLAVLVIYLKRSKAKTYRLSFFLNLLFSIYLLVDLGMLAWMTQHHSSNELAVYGLEKKQEGIACDDCKNPDIYFLLFDAYESSAGLRQAFGYDNSALDSLLRQKDFFIQGGSSSNYNFTPFSMASILNMNYLEGVSSVNQVTLADYNACSKLIRDDAVIRFLAARQYQIVNYSIFDLAGHPSPVVMDLLPTKTRLITAQTLPDRFLRDLAWNFYSGKHEIKWLTRNRLYKLLDNDNYLAEQVKKESKTPRNSPRFVYAHFEMPHDPFYYDKDKKLRSRAELMSELSGIHIASYTGYLPYVNDQLVSLVNEIQQNTHRAAVIIIMGDHGYRVPVKNVSTSHYFKNLNAVYFPDRNYSLLKDSSTGVNQFRTIFNSLFKQNFPLLKDSTVFLTDVGSGKQP